MSMFFVVSPSMGNLATRILKSLYAFLAKVRLCVPALHQASVEPFKLADYYGTFYDDGDNRDAKSIHRKTCPACSLRSILLLNLMILLHFDMIKVV